ncbi:hypothetical protein C2134_19990 [Chromobacterium sinusclupearum]|uniref:Uncharacterized protein n=1 Tax=Chromobacterium sinusclupearum TaxID=2077146 RepID=A0A2K4MIC8_9NEIS|nr:hypothetical protein [Chromobacterium sinusclupearum]POA96828.1 hypothetical protein C2134_19990 [Chromobacterium sinusclupearum]
MTTSNLFAGRELLSESNLHKVFSSELGGSLSLEPRAESASISADGVKEMLGSWRAAIEREAVALARLAPSALTDLPPGCLYEHQDQPDWLLAAQACEIFRNPIVSKNAGRLDVKALQRNIRAWLGRDGEPTLVIGWGQPKRSAGGLKAFGPYADLAEMYAIGRLLVIVKALEKMAGRPIKLAVLTGGSRFFEAFFTRPELTLRYDQQRQAIADALAGPGVIEFQAYSQAVGDGGHTAISGERAVKFRQALAGVSDEMAAAKFGTVLLNVDWEHIFAPDPAQRQKAPHGLPLPDSVAAWLATGDANRLVRAAVTSLISPRHQAACLDMIGSETVLEDAISFIQSVAWESTRKYIALHLMDGGDETAGASEASGRNALRLTVHEKDKLRDMPAIFTLGPRGGNQLSQHVLAMVGERGETVFGAYAEFWAGPARAVRLEPQGDYPVFAWLAESGQPLCLSSVADEALLQALCRASAAA